MFRQLSLFNEVLDCLDVVFAPFEPSVIVHPSRYLVHPLKYCAFCCVMQFCCMVSRNDFILKANYELNRDSNLRDSVYRRPKDPLDKLLEVRKERKDVVYHFRY